MPAKRIAGMARSYRYPQADRRNCHPSLLRNSAPSKSASELAAAAATIPTQNAIEPAHLTRTWHVRP